MYHATTQNIQVSVIPVYIDEKSDPASETFFWAYRVRIENEGKDVVQLLTRHWKIINAHGDVEVVNGSGVVGEQPILKSGDVFEYTSGCPLNTDSGFMTGAYKMINQAGTEFDVQIPTFSLDLPDHDPVYN